MKINMKNCENNVRDLSDTGQGILLAVSAVILFSSEAAWSDVPSDTDLKLLLFPLFSSYAAIKGEK